MFSLPSSPHAALTHQIPQLFQDTHLTAWAAFPFSSEEGWRFVALQKYVVWLCSLFLNQCFPSGRGGTSFRAAGDAGMYFHSLAEPQG